LTAETERGDQEWVTRTPPGRLRPFIERYIGYRLVGFPPGVHRGLPSRHMTFIASIGPSIDVVAQTDPSQRPQSYRTVLSGLQASTALIQHDGNQEGIAFELTPLGSRVLFGMPARELWDRSLELADVVGSAGSELSERLESASGWVARFQVCDEVLSRLAGDDVVAPELQHCWATLVGSDGHVSVSDLASEVGYSHVSIAQVASACGYYDQAHLYRDFAELAGCTPRDLLAEDLPNFQDELASGDS
jgi:AraC-like DNA-binding protein